MGSRSNRVREINGGVRWLRVCRVCGTSFRAQRVEDRLCDRCREALQPLADPPLPPQDPAT
jgi:rRNA maturation endonuclease Nob1